MELRGAGAEGVFGDERWILDRHLQGTARIGGPHAAVLDAERAATRARRNLRRVGLPGQGERDVPAVALAVDQHARDLTKTRPAPARPHLEAPAPRESSGSR